MAMELPAMRACKHPVLVPDGHGLHGAFCSVVVQFQKAVIKVWRCTHAAKIRFPHIGKSGIRTRASTIL